MSTLYPWGYAKRLVDMNELKRLARFDVMDPAYAARLEAWLVSRNGHIGVGGALRIVQPDKPGFAPAGQSFHQIQLFHDKAKMFMAVDLVCRNGDSTHRGPRWDEVPRQGSGHSDISTYGVHCNVSGEPWHMQAMEVDGYQTWVNNGRKHPNPNFQITPPPIVDPIPPTPVPQPDPVPTPEPDMPAIPPGQRELHFTAPHMRGWDVLFVQGVVRDKASQTVAQNGEYDAETVLAVKNVQAWFGLTADGIVGAKTWELLIELSKPAPPAPEPAPVDRVLMVTTPPMHGLDVMFVQGVVRDKASQTYVTVDGYYGPTTEGAVKNVQAWFGLTADGVVGPKTWALMRELSQN